MTSTSAVRALTAAVTVGSLAGAAPRASAEVGTSAAQVAEEEHCVIYVLGQEPSGRYITSEPTCYPTLEEVLADVDRAESRTLLRAAGSLLGPVVRAALSQSLAQHFDGANLTGSSITVVGSGCSGGYVNLSSAWTNRISSAINDCPNVNYYDGFDKTGDSEFTQGLGDKYLTPLNNRANSIGYA